MGEAVSTAALTVKHFIVVKTIIICIAIITMVAIAIA